MIMIPISFNDIEPEVEFSASRSSGAGGQNVNKVNSKVTLRWNVISSKLISEEQRGLILQKLKTQLTNDGNLIVSNQKNRSQLQNRDAAIQKFNAVLKKVFTVQKSRKKSKPSKSSIKKRLDSKSKHAEKKQLRRRLD